MLPMELLPPQAGTEAVLPPLMMVEYDIPDDLPRQVVEIAQLPAVTLAGLFGLLSAGMVFEVS